MNRAQFMQRMLAGGAALSVAPWWLNSCTTANAAYTVSLRENAARGHRLREGNFPEPSHTVHCETLILGGGIGALSAAYHMQQKNLPFLLLELDDALGGNSSAAQNHVSAYPLGAHYLPIADTDDHILLQFLRDNGIIIGEKNGLPIYHEEYLCADPDERLFFQGAWQTGLIPHYAVSAATRAQIKSFLQRMQTFRDAIGSDGKRAFCIPLHHSSTDEAFTSLDAITMAHWMAHEGFTDPALLWYVDYSCRDDFGTSMHECSAWAGIHYFAARRGKAANAEAHDVLTWPQGNHFLVEKLTASLPPEQCLTGQLVYHIAQHAEGVEVYAFNFSTQQSTRYISPHCINALPLFIHKYFTGNVAEALATQATQATYAPWLVANLTLHKSPQEAAGTAMAWDNVVFGSTSLGYVNACHQQLTAHPKALVLTYYKALAEGPPAEVRKAAREKTPEAWAEEIVQELEQVHSNLRECLQHVEVKLWGHAMQRPDLGAVWTRRAQLHQALLAFPSLHYAHSDASVISIFEEAFHHGYEAAQKIINA